MDTHNANTTLRCISSIHNLTPSSGIQLWQANSIPIIPSMLCHFSVYHSYYTYVAHIHWYYLHTLSIILCTLLVPTNYIVTTIVRWYNMMIVVYRTQHNAYTTVWHYTSDQIWVPVCMVFHENTFMIIGRSVGATLWDSTV